MTKLLEWITALVVFLAVWLALLTGENIFKLKYQIFIHFLLVLIRVTSFLHPSEAYDTRKSFAVPRLTNYDTRKLFAVLRSL